MDVKSERHCQKYLSSVVENMYIRITIKFNSLVVEHNCSGLKYMNNHLNITVQ